MIDRWTDGRFLCFAENRDMKLQQVHLNSTILLYY